MSYEEPIFIKGAHGNELNGAYVARLYGRLLNETGRTSLAAVAKRMTELGIICRKTGRPYTRQALHLALLRCPEGMAVLDRKKREAGRDRYEE
jgi:hypothetical protein